MTENPTYAEVEAALLSRWPESRLEPSLDRIRALTELLGDPQAAYPVVHLTGTNGKTSTSRMIDTLISARGLRTGRFTSPHVESMTERISVDGEPLDEDAFVQAYVDVAPFAEIVDASGEHPLSFFEMVVGMAYAAFADAPVDAAVVEVGMGGSWDATNVVDASVAVITPIAVDHARYLGDRPGDIAVEKAGIIKPGATVVMADQTDEVVAVVVARAQEVGATVVREGLDFGVVSRLPAVGGQVLTLRGLRGEYDEIFLPLYGAHQAQNAAVALAAVEAFAGDEPLDEELVRSAFAEVTSPGRLEVIRRGPTILLDAAHNPHGAAAMVEAIRDSFTFDPLVGVVGVMADKDVEGLLAELEPVLSEIVCTQNSTDRSMKAADLGEVAGDIFGEHRVRVVERLDDAIELAVTLAETGGVLGESIGSGGVLVTGSVVTVGEARVLLKRKLS
ncbi:MAG TPA: folylpolyglutamate synthase/dihydrofolate synthase family protein [Nocardioidaceae bacterium]|nr:folylpolyglutamate synthase/dihydrofolate synthase family protein [Nocardioidaceae bacterium]